MPRQFHLRNGDGLMSRETTLFLFPSPRMKRLSAVAKRFPLATFFGLSAAVTWVLLPLARISNVVSLLALWGPAVAAVVTAALLGSDQLASLRDRITRWRVPVRWYALALLLPLPISAVAALLEYLGAKGPVQFQAVSALQMIVFVLVLGEEIGWRGFALPILLARVSPWRASIILGTAWALWHLPLFYIPEMPQFGSPFVPFVAYTISLSVILTMFWQRTGGSIVIATLFHGAVNTFGLVNVSATPFMRGWGNAVSYSLVALIVGAALWKGIPHRRTSPRA